MTVKTTKLRDAIVFALVAGATGVAGTGVAFAQDTAQDQPAAQQEAQQLDTIVVTGTRIQSQTVTSSSPVTEIAQEEFQFTGATRTEDLVNQYPQMSPAFDSFNNNPSLGYPTVDLRGLGAARTLTLVNGFRLPPGAGEVPDISIVPSALVKRVDLLTGGASAVYGSDAIAGVVNFVLDDEFEGVSLSAGYSAYQHNNDNRYIQGLMDEAGYPYPDGNSGFDGISRNIDLVVGSAFADGRGHATAWATWRKNDPLFQGERDYSSCALDDPGTTCGGSATNAAGNFVLSQQLPYDGPDLNDALDAVGTLASHNPDGSGRFIAEQGTPYNYAPANYYQRPDERYTFGTSLKYEINEHFRPYLEAMFLNRRDSVELAPSGTFSVRLTGADCSDPLLQTLCEDVRAYQLANPTPDADGIPLPALDPNVPVDISILKRNVEGGPRHTDTENTQWRVVAGMEGALDEAWSYNASFLHGQTSTDSQGINDFLFSRILTAINGCQPGAFAGCLPYDIFTPGGVTPEAAAALSGTSMNKTTTELNSVNAYVSGDLGMGLPWADENIALVMGGEWREAKFDFTADAASQAGDFAGAGGPSVPVGGKTSVSEVFLESAVPLFRGDGAFRSMDLDLGYRLSDYERSGTASTWKVGLTANLADQVRIRTGFNRAIRAPSVINLFNPQSLGLFTGSDPCAGTTPDFTREQCVNAGVPSERYGTIIGNPASQNNQLTGGSLDLEPESAETFTFGVVYTPTDNMRFNVDYYDIKIGDTIATIGSSTILNFCATTGDPLLCSKIHRNPTTYDLWIGSDPANSGYVENLTSNFGERHFRGLDLGGMYRFDLGPGRLTTSLQGTYVLEEEIAPLPGVNDDATYDCAGLINDSCQTPDWRHIANARYSFDRYTVNLRWRYFGQMDYEETTGEEGTTDELVAADGGIDAYSYFDLSASALIGEYMELTMGVNNIADKEPPMVGGTLVLNGNAPGGYDQAGRFFFGSVTFRF